MSDPTVNSYDVDVSVSESKERIDTFVKDYVSFNETLASLVAGNDMSAQERFIDYLKAYQGEAAPLASKLSQMTDWEVEVASIQGEGANPHNINETVLTTDLTVAAVEELMTHADDVDIMDVVTRLQDANDEPPSMEEAEQAFHAERLSAHVAALSVFQSFELISDITSSQMDDVDPLDGSGTDFAAEMERVELASGYSKEYIMREIEADLISLGVEYDPAIFEQDDIGAVVSGVNVALNNHDDFIEPAPPASDAQAGLGVGAPAAQVSALKV